MSNGPWFELANSGGFACPSAGTALVTRQNGTNDWRIRPTGVNEDLKGSYTTQADAHEAARKISQGVDPTSLI